VAVWGEAPDGVMTHLGRVGTLELHRWEGSTDALRTDLEAGRLAPPAPTQADRGPEADNALIRAARAAISSRRVDAVLVLWPEFEKALNGGGLPKLSIYFDSVREDSVEASDRVQRALGEFRRQVIERRERERGLSAGFSTGFEMAAHNVASGSRRSGQLLGMLLPFLLIALSLLGGFYPAIDVTAGEKERGTMQTLMCAPLRPAEIIVGKFVAVWLIALIAALANVISLAATTSRVLPGNFSVGLSAYLLMFVMLLPVTFLITAVFLAVAVFAKDFKDGQNFLTPAYMVLGLPAAVTMLPGVELSAWTAFVPVVNIALLIKALLVGDATADMLFIVLLSSTTYAALAVMLAARVFEREQILLGGRESMRAVLGLERGTRALPTPALALTMFAIVLVLAFYGSLFTAPLGVVVTLLVIQLGFFLLPLLAAIGLFGFAARPTLSLRPPPVRGLIAAVLVGSTGWMVASGVLVRLLPPPESLARAMEQILMLGSDEPVPLWQLWLVIGILPAACEELFFRGFVLTGLRKLGMWPAVVTSGLLFGIAHSSIYRILPTLFLGIVFGYLVWKTGSVVCSIVAHALNNGVMVTIASSEDARRTLGLSEDSTFLPLSYALVGVVVLAVALVLVRLEARPHPGAK
jgi:sodium transport system permease protein